MGLWASCAVAGCLDAPDPCETPKGSYHIVLPDPLVADGPAVVFLHGAGGSGMGALRNTGMSGEMLRRGYAVIGANGLPRPGRFGTGWYFHPERAQDRDEIAFLKELRDDAARRFGLDAERMILAGFSVGGSMTSYAACQDPGSFAAYAPVAGSFWRPHPEGCAGPVRLFHTHGWKDKTVPLEGRPLGGGVIYQGDVWHAMTLWRAVNGCDGLRADSFSERDQFWVRHWDSCAPGTALDFALHPGGHGIPRGWSAMMLDWFEALPAR